MQSLHFQHSVAERGIFGYRLKRFLHSINSQPLFTTGRGPSIPLEHPSDEYRQSVLAEVERLHCEYLEAKREFRRIQADDRLPEHVRALIKARMGRQVALTRYIDAAAKADGED